MELNDWKTTGKYFTYKKKYPIFYQTAGRGTGLLLLHGFPTASWDWHKIWPDLSKRFQLIAPDFIGFGFSAKPHFYPYSIHDQADIVEQLLSHLGINEVHVLAHDYGDTVLQELLARFNERQRNKIKGLTLKSVVLLNGGLFPETHRPRPIQKALISPIGLLLTPFLNKEKLRSNFAAIFGKDTQATAAEIDEFYQLTICNNGKYIFHKLIRYMAERKKYRERWVSALQNASIPIRLINGGADPVSGKHMVERYQSLVAQPDILMLEHIGHYPQTEAPALVLKGVLDFIKNEE